MESVNETAKSGRCALRFVRANFSGSKFALVININTTKALGLTIPETPLATADKMIR